LRLALLRNRRSWKFNGLRAKVAPREAAVLAWEKAFAALFVMPRKRLSNREITSMVSGLEIMRIDGLIIEGA
jgi:hypothetical protein